MSIEFQDYFLVSYFVIYIYICILKGYILFLLKFYFCKENGIILMFWLILVY